MARLKNARNKVEKEAPIMPFFDCLFCCQEHFVLSKVCESMIQMKYCYNMGKIGYEKAKQARMKYDDFENAKDAFKELL